MSDQTKDTATNPADSSATAEPVDASVATAPTAAPVRFPDVRQVEATGPEAPLDRVYGLNVPVQVELGRTTLSVEEILRMAPGTVVELDRAADAPVELFVHGKCVAKGEIVVVDDFYGVRITAVS